MFNSLKLTGACFESIYKISTFIRGTGLSKNNILANSTPDERKRDSVFKEFIDVSRTTNDKKTLRNASPFHKYYENKIKEYREKGLTDSSENFSNNEFYCPKLFDMLARNLYLIPIWSGIMINTQGIGYSTKTRLSNNPVENWIGQLKNNILKDDIVSMIFIKSLNVLLKPFKLH